MDNRSKEGKFSLNTDPAIAQISENTLGTEQVQTDHRLSIPKRQADNHITILQEGEDEELRDIVM